MPLEAEYEAEIGKSGNRWTYTKRQEEFAKASRPRRASAACGTSG